LIFNCLTGVPVEGKEVLKWLVYCKLHCPLLRNLKRLLNKEKVVAGKCRNTIAELVCLVHALFHTLAVIFKESSVLHDLNATILEHTTSLRAIIQYCELEACLCIHNRDSTIDRIIVGSHIER
jgi:hypothetical protein